MIEIRKSLNRMADVKIDCGPIASSDIEKPDETIYIKWIEKNQSINAGYVNKVRLEIKPVAYGSGAIAL